MAVKYFIHYITRYGFRAFGWYRNCRRALILLLPFCGVSLKTEHEHEQAATQNGGKLHNRREKVHGFH